MRPDVSDFRCICCSFCLDLDSLGTGGSRLICQQEPLLRLARCAAPSGRQAVTCSSRPPVRCGAGLTSHRHLAPLLSTGLPLSLDWEEWIVFSRKPTHNPSCCQADHFLPLEVPNRAFWLTVLSSPIYDRTVGFPKEELQDRTPNVSCLHDIESRVIRNECEGWWPLNLHP